MAESSEQKVPAWILSACSEEVDRPKLNTPHTVIYRDQTWTAGTNGHVMALVREDLGLPDSSLDWLKVLQVPNAEPIELDMAALRDWAGCPPVGQACTHCMDARKVPCRACSGQGHSEHECSCGDLHDAECETCYGKRTIACVLCSPDQFGEKERVRMFGGIFNKTLLRRVLNNFPADDERFARATWRQADARHVGWIEAIDGSWIIGLMPLDPGSTILPKGAPSFPSSAVTA